MTVADRIRNKRIELALSQTELAKRAGYTDKTTISKFEHAGDNISMKQIKRVADALGVTSAFLMGWEDEDGRRTMSGQLYDAYNDESKISKAMEFYSLYASAVPEVRAAIETLLKSAQPGHGPLDEP